MPFWRRNDRREDGMTDDSGGSAVVDVLGWEGHYVVAAPIEQHVGKSQGRNVSLYRNCCHRLEVPNRDLDGTSS